MFSNVPLFSLKHKDKSLMKQSLKIDVQEVFQACSFYYEVFIF